MIKNNQSVGENVGVASATSSDALSVYKPQSTTNKPEVLAPAGSFDSIIAAVRSGTDAVYFGAPSFNARRNAENFGREEMKTAIEFCRIRGVKTYLTLNTLVADCEMNAALDEARFAALCGIDAIIVQDLGLASALKKHLPLVPLHASTQMSIHSADALPVLKKLGFSRVVPAREMDKKALESFCKKAKELNIEVEVFVHGALCMCLSGQCYLSALLGGRSGNRGLCAQPCRLDFSVKNGTGHDLSLKDMSILQFIDCLAEMGICSLKIEGRMKRPEYVAAACTVARAAVDKTEVSESAKQLLSGIFSRSGHTDGYFTEKLGPDMFGIRTSGDEKLSAELINTAHELYRRDRQSIPLNARFVLKAGQPSTLTVTDDDRHSVTVSGTIPEAAKTTGTTPEQIKEKLSKLGGTCYYLGHLECETEDGLFISGGELNSLRRQAADQMNAARNIFKARCNGAEIKVSLPEASKRAEKCSVVAFFRNFSQIPADCRNLDAVILPVETDFSKVSLPNKIRVLANIPRGVMHFGDKVKEQLREAMKNGVRAAVAGNLAALTLCNEVGIPVVAGFGLNTFNSFSLDALDKLDIKAAVCSFELTAEGIKNLRSPIPVGAITYGRLPLMIFRNCPGKNGDGCKNCSGKATLCDRKNIEFPVMCRGEFSEMFNSRVLWNFDRIYDISPDFQVLFFTDEEPSRCREIIDAAVNMSAPDCEYTRGLYYRGVQ